MQLSFVQSNWLRSYPFRAGTELDLSNNVVPTDLLAALKITCEASELEVYISKIVTNNGTISITFSGASGPIGFANGVILMSNQSLLIHNQKNGVIGNVTIGNPDSVNTRQTFTFNSTIGLVEPSTVTVISPPSVTSLNIKGNKLVGAIKLTSNTAGITAGGSIGLNVNRPADIQSRNDISASRLTCGNNVISGINTVSPDEHGNIDIYAIAPVQVSIVDGNIKLDSPDTPLSVICKTLNLPPIDSTQTSHQSISSIANPEWHGWTQHQ